MTPEVILLMAGVLFLAVATFGGGFTAKELSIPKVPTGGRIASGVIAVLFFVSAALLIWSGQPLTNAFPLASQVTENDGQGEGNPATPTREASETAERRTEENNPSPDEDPDPPAPTRRLTSSEIRRVSASSVLAPQASFNYRPINVTDGDPGTAWAEGVDGAGTGEWLDFDFADTVEVIAIEILNGYNRTPETFTNNGRVRLVRITTEGDDIVVALDDTMQYQTIEETFGRTNSARMTIESVYQGERFNDTLVSEISFIVRE